jgi:hypothetical protein
VTCASPDPTLGASSWTQQTPFNPALAEHWLIVVAELGYPLSAVEQQVAIDARRRIEEDPVADSVAEDGEPALD